MRRTLRELALAVGAGAVGLLLTIMIDDMDTTWRVVITLAAALVGFGAAHLLFPRESLEKPQGVSVGADLRSRSGGIGVRDVNVAPTSGDVEVGRRIDADGDIEVSGIDINREKSDS